MRFSRPVVIVLMSGLSAPGSPRSAAAGRASPPARNARRARPRCGRAAARRRAKRLRALSTTGRRARWSPSSTRCRRRSSPRSTCTAIPVTSPPPTRSTASCRIMDSLNLKVMLVAENVSGERLDADAGRAQRLAAQGSLPRPLRRRLPQRRAGMGRQRRQAARSRREGRRASASAKCAKGFGLRTTKPDGSRLKRRRSRARSAVGRVRAARRARRSSTPRSRRSSSSRSTTRTSAGSSCRCSPIGATTSRARSPSSS